MLHRALESYLERVEQAVELLEDAYIERYVEEILTEQRATLRIRIRFEGGCLLEINEAMVVKGERLQWLDYRYHCQDGRNQLIFRYDSTPHFPDLPSFPHHKHLPDGVIASQRPEIFQVLREALTCDRGG